MPFYRCKQHSTLAYACLQMKSSLYLQVTTSLKHLSCVSEKSKISVIYFLTCTESVSIHTRPYYASASERKLPFDRYLVLIRRLNTFASVKMSLKLDYYFSICKIFFQNQVKGEVVISKEQLNGLDGALYYGKYPEIWMCLNASMKCYIVKTGSNKKSFF